MDSGEDIPRSSFPLIPLLKESQFNSKPPFADLEESRAIAGPTKDVRSHFAMFDDASIYNTFFSDFDCTNLAPLPFAVIFAFKESYLISESLYNTTCVSHIFTGILLDSPIYFSLANKYNM